MSEIMVTSTMFCKYAGPLYVADDTFRNRFNPPGHLGDNAQTGASPRRILVVDDERRITDTLSEILRISGFQVESAYDGWEAIGIASRFQPDCLLSDVLMPYMNGVELAIAVQKICPLARILLFSGQAGISDILLDAQARGHEFELIAKPIHPLKLVERLREQK